MSSAKWRMLTVFLTAAGLASALSGCRDASAAYKAAFTDRLKTEQDLLAILKDVHDEASMEKALPELRKISWRSQKSKKAFEALPALADEAREELERTFQPPLQAVKQEQAQEALRIKALAGGEDFLNRMKHL
jgi:hypothetical protein